MSSATPQRTTIVWFRDDLRIADNAALAAAAAAGAVLPVFIRETGDHARPLGGARRWWLHHSLSALSAKLAGLGASMVLATGDPYVVLGALAQQTGADRITWNRRYQPEAIDHDTELKSRLSGDGFEVETFAGFLLHEPTRLKTGSDSFFKVFSPFWRSLESSCEYREPLEAPESLTAVANHLKSETLSDWKLLPIAPDWSGGLVETWKPGEDAGREKLADFARNGAGEYKDNRDRPDIDATSRLSPHLAFGEISPAQVFAALKDDADAYRRQVGWREFSWHLLVNAPDLAQTNHNSRFDGFPWADNPEALDAWRSGMTGYPIVDAGMRQLRRTGWMHNRVRMVAASFLTKHLLVHWKEGEDWFWDNLVDADPASNSASWQWVAGSGFDAAPYFRIFNPILQGEKFDPEGAYVRAFVPEIAALPTKYIHKPWDAPDHLLAEAGIELGKTYPHPIVDHARARERALSAYSNIKDAA